MRHVWRLAALFLGAVVWMCGPVPADEGMWTFDNPPAKQIREKYGFVLTPEWLDHIRLSSVRFNDGGSGSFVSPQGLILTNHHVALGQLQKVSSPQKNYVSTCDIIGGNSGSPVINNSGQIVGLIFDGNIESLVGRYIYSEADNRAVAVDTAAMTEALRKLYGAQDLVNEMMPGKFPATQ
jgi:S1-C subfamily serine protease